ncbi:hypothetical protein SETIT_9G132800v2 [Setaria italica]|uniref:PB1 domain-containing protein n=1 Tax=Setaria italica TaxID=4555 RepID=A0A368SG42_SETIT|nr:hypothetical protein SETIT_9G132800v2 [Setaria italica]
MKLLCNHGGCLLPRGPDGAIRYAGGETRVLAVSRDLTRRLAEMAGGAAVLAVRHRLADEGLEDVLVSVTYDEELAHMRDEYDRLLATRPTARFRVFVTTTAASAGSGAGGFVHRGRSAAAGLPPLAPKIRRSAQEFAGATHAQQSFRHHRHQQCCCSCHCQRRELCAPAPATARRMYPAPYMSKKVAAGPSMPAAEATARVVFTDAAREKARSRDT